MGLTRPRAAQIYDIDYKQAVRVITTSNITLSGGAPVVVDGVTLSLNDRVLVSGQTTASQNGIYIVSVLGTGANGTWIRSTDTNATGELLSGTIVMVTEGSTYADTSWKLTTNDPITIGTTALTFEINTGNAFGVISANGTSVVANSATGTVTFSTSNNIVITVNATSDTITFAVADSPTFYGNVLPGANITYDLGSTSSRWRDIYLANSTIYLGNAQISANATAVTITNPAGGTTVLSGATPGISVSTVTATGNITGGNLITNGELSVTGNANIGNLGATNANVSAITATGNADVGNLGTAGQVTAIGNVTGGNLVTSGQLTASGNITGNYLLANITFASGYNTTKLFNGTSEANIGTSGGNANITIGGVSNVAVFSTAGANITGTLGATGNITGGNLTTAGNITGNYLLANITFASGYNTTKLFNGTSEANIGTSGGNLEVTIGGTPNIAVFSTSGANITGNLYTTGNVSGGNILGNGRNLSGIETFKSFAVSGGNTITADSITDTFTFNAGTGITLVADPTTDTLTIAAAGEGSDIFVDGADFGEVSEVVTTTDDLGSIADAVTSEADLGSIVTAGVFYPDQIVFPSYTVAGVPSASPAGQMIYVTNESGGAVPAFSDGTNWRRVTDRAIIT